MSIDWTKLIGPLYSTGLVGLLLVLLILEKGIVTKTSMERQNDSHVRELAAKEEIIKNQAFDLQSLKTANAELQRLTSEKMIPALVQATEVSRAYVSELSRRGGTQSGT